uniref:Uncharacterized protein n=1 Tax=Anopheles atroparvus TaxID=41427 RepID=A0A182J9T1_ANOAO
MDRTNCTELGSKIDNRPRLQLQLNSSGKQPPGGLDERRQRPQLHAILQERVSEQLVGGGAHVHLHLQAAVEKVFQVVRQLVPALNVRPAVRGDQVERTERRLVQGGWPSIISIAMMPSDQMSTFLPYCLRVTTSGAIQYGVPTIVCRFSSPSMLAQKPKSVTFTEPSMPSSTLSDLMSRWMMPFACRKLMASSTSRHTAAIWRSFITVSVTTSVSGPPSMYSRMTHSWSTSSRIDSFDDWFFMSIVLMATFWPVLRSSAMNTTPEAPLPTSTVFSYRRSGSLRLQIFFSSWYTCSSLFGCRASVSFGRRIRSVSCSASRSKLLLFTCDPISCGFGGSVMLFFGRGGGGAAGPVSFSSLLPASESTLLWVVFWSRNWSIDSVSSWIASSVMNGLNGSVASFFLIE